MPEYKEDKRLQGCKKEVNKPPSKLYEALGYDKNPGDETKHYRKYFIDALESENHTDILRPNIFDKYKIYGAVKEKEEESLDLLQILFNDKKNEIL